MIGPPRRPVCISSKAIPRLCASTKTFLRVYRPRNGKAALFWANSYLPAVGPTVENGSWNSSEKTGGMLNELEKAHIYIEQLNAELGRIHTELAGESGLIDELVVRLKRLDAGSPARRRSSQAATLREKHSREWSGRPRRLESRPGACGLCESPAFAASHGGLVNRNYEPSFVDTPGTLTAKNRRLRLAEKLERSSGPDVDPLLQHRPARLFAFVKVLIIRIELLFMR